MTLFNAASLRAAGIALGLSLLATVPLPPLNAADKPSPAPSGVTRLFDGTTLKGWKPTPFGGAGEITVKDGAIQLEMGHMTGVTWTNAVPKMDYELSLEAKRTQGNDFFCGLTFPVGDSHVTLIAGGWGGALVGISSINGGDASENETTKFQRFEKDRYYKIRVRVEPKKIQAWIDDEQFVNLDTVGKSLALRPGETELSKPLGIATWNTASAIRNVQLKALPPSGDPAASKK